MDEQHLNRLNNDRLQSRQVDELIGLARGLVADGNINNAEVEFLHSWLLNNLAISHQPLIATLYERVREILEDGVVDPDECADLFAALTRFTAADAEVGEATKATTLPLCNPAPTLSYVGKRYCFTGTFSFGQRKHCEQAVKSRGGSAGSLTRQTDFLVIGTYATDSWKHSSFGHKILQAVEVRAAGGAMSIMSEEHWTKSLD